MKRKASVTIILNEDNKILILKRAKGSRSFGGYWNFPGGSVEPGETIETAAVRELEEEAGLKVSESDLLYFTISNLPTLIVHFFMTNKWDGEVEINNESTEWKWATIDEIKKLKFIPMTPHMIDDIEHYMEFTK